MMPKPKKCAVCKEPFAPRNSMQKACSPGCALEIAKSIRAKKEQAKATAERKADKAKREAMKTLSDHMRDTQVVFNRWIRARDIASGYGCISCGTTANVQYAAGHFRTVGAAPHLRFDEDNVHLQCNKNCNLKKSGNVLAYRAALIDRIGLERVEKLESDNAPKKYTVQDLKNIKAEYRKKLKELHKSK